MLIKRLRLRPDTATTTSSSAENNNSDTPPVNRERSRIFEDHHHDLLLPAPLAAPTLDPGNPTISSSDFVPTSIPPPILHVVPTEDDSILRLSVDLQHACPPPYNPNFIFEDVLPPPSPPPLRGFPPSPCHQREEDIPFVTATCVVEDEDCYNGAAVSASTTFATRRSRANTFAPSSTGSWLEQVEADDAIAATAHCIFIPPSDVQQVVVDEEDGNQEQGRRAVLEGSCSRSFADPPSSPSVSAGTRRTGTRSTTAVLPFPVRKLLLRNVGRDARGVCTKTLQMARDQVELRRPAIQHAARRSASMAKQASVRVKDRSKEFWHQNRDTVQHTAKVTARTLVKSSQSACHAIQEWDSKHRVSHQVMVHAHRGLKQGTKMIRRQVLSSLGHVQNGKKSTTLT